VNIPCSGRSRGRPRGVGPPPHISGKKEKITEGKKAGRASKTTPPPPPLAQGLDPQSAINIFTGFSLVSI